MIIFFHVDTFIFISMTILFSVGFPVLVVKSPPANAGDRRNAGSILELGRSSGEGVATHSSILTWKIPWTGAWHATVHGTAKRQMQLSTLFSVLHVLFGSL